MSHEIFLRGKVQLCCGNSMHFLKDQPDNRYDSIVTDPPYALVSIGKRFGADGAAAVKVPEGGSGAYARASAGFMGKRWDTGETAFAIEFWQECLRVLKPGGHVVAFGGTRTYHRLACAIEDAGFEIRDQLQWIYGSGFPKSHDVSKGIDRAAGAEREIVGSKPKTGGGRAAPSHEGWQRPWMKEDGARNKPFEITAPATEDAEQWSGWGTALKPACEPICLARKPLIGTVAANVLQHGVGALNIDGCRVEGAAEDYATGGQNTSIAFHTTPVANKQRTEQHAQGRWPANICHDGSDEVIAAFPDVGLSSGGKNRTGFSKDPGWDRPSHADWKPSASQGGFGDEGSAARFFYTAKADSMDRLGSRHPTVKPVDLMQWLVRLITPKGGLVLDPFAGTGTTAEAAFREGMRCMLVERETEYQADIRRRMALVLGGPEERRRESIKAKTKDQPVDHGPLFSLALDSQTS